MLQALYAISAILGLGLIVTGLSGCSTESKKRKILPKEPPDQYVPPKDILYERQCIFGSNCKSFEKIASAYDYVGMVYGKKGKVTYNNVLTAEERSYVEKTFGKISRPQEIPSLIQFAQKKSLKEFYSPTMHPLCLTLSLWKVLHAQDPTYGEAYIIGGTHHCFEIFAATFAELELEQKIAANPDDWIFFIESSKSLENEKRKGIDIRQDEFALFNQISDRLGIPVENPLVPVDDEAVIKKMEKEGVSRMNQAVYWAVGQLNNNILSRDPKFRKEFYRLEYHERSRVLHKILSKYFVTREKTHSIIAGTVESYKVDSKNFQKACEDFLKLPPGEDRATFFEKRLDQIENVFKRMIQTSNKLSAEHLRTQLKKHKKRKAFIQIGSGHTPFIPRVYKDVQVFVPSFSR